MASKFHKFLVSYLEFLDFLAIFANDPKYFNDKHFSKVGLWGEHIKHSLGVARKKIQDVFNSVFLK